MNSDILIELDDCFIVRLKNQDIVFEFEDSNERADQYDNAIKLLTEKLINNKNNFPRTIK